MKKIFVILLMVGMVLTGCTKTELKENFPTVSIVDFTGEQKDVRINPKKVAIFIPQALDIMDAAGYENTGIEVLGIQKNNLPNYLSQYQTADYLNVGTLFEADLDVLDMMQPDMIIYGGRFGAEGRVAEGKTLKEIIERYPDIDFVNLEFGEENLENNIQKNFEILSSIFPDIKDDLDQAFESIQESFQTIRQGINDLKTIFIMPSGGNLQFYGPNSRFGYIHTNFGFKSAVITENTQANHGDSISTEFIMKTSPDIILLLDREAITSNGSSAIFDFKENAMIQKTNAYKNNYIFELDPNAWYIMPGGYTSTLQMIDDLTLVIEAIK